MYLAGRIWLYGVWNRRGEHTEVVSSTQGYGRVGEVLACDIGGAEARQPGGSGVGGAGAEVGVVEDGVLCGLAITCLMDSFLFFPPT